MSYRLEDQPEWAGVQGEETESGRVAQYGDPGMPSIGRIVPPRAYPVPAVSGDQLVPAAEPPPDPSAEAIQRTIEAERAADAGKTVPPDALEVTS